MEKKFNVSSICNVLVDLLIYVDDKDLKHFGLNKGKMHLIDSEKQADILKYFSDHQKKVELGGSALNTIKTLAQLGSPVSFTGMVGRDTYGSEAEEKMLEVGITPHLLEHHTEATGTCLVMITSDGERTLNTHLGAGSLFEDSQMSYTTIKQSKIFHFTGYQWQTEEQRKVIEKAIDIARVNDCLVSFDLADPFVVKDYAQEFLDLINEKVDIFFANREESYLLFDGDLKNKFSDRVTGIIKLDKEGALIYKNGGKVAIPPTKTKVKDTTGAGDIFAAGYLYALLADQSMSLCGEVAATLASDVISHVGAYISSNAKEKALSLVAQHKSLSSELRL